MGVVVFVFCVCFCLLGGFVLVWFVLRIVSLLSTMTPQSIRTSHTSSSLQQSVVNI